MMSYYDREILSGLDQIPTPECPSVLIVTGGSQPIFTGENPGEVFLAACKLGYGKVLVSGHDCYLEWLNNNEDELKVKFMRNVKTWLTRKRNLNESEIIDLEDIKDNLDQLKQYSIVKWNQTNLDDEQEEKLLKYIYKGGINC